MGIMQRLNTRITMTVLQRQCMIIVTLLSTLCLMRAWPRFHDDAMSIAWWGYLLPIALFAIPLFRRA